MRDDVTKDDCDIEMMVALIGAPPAAPMNVARQQLERAKDQTQLCLVPRLRGAIWSKVGH